MKKVKTYKQFINEEFVDSSNVLNKLTTFMDSNIKNIKRWFEGSLIPNSTLNEIRKTDNPSSNDIIFEFDDGYMYYQIIFTVRVEDYKDGNFENGFLKIKKFSLDVDGVDPNGALKGLLLDEWDSNNPANGMDNGQINIKDNFNPDFILSKISEMEDEPKALGSVNIIKNKTEEGDKINKQTKESEF